ncbi:MAG: hypothetical protein GY714_07765 [Desulfobacterales bacterium]|nr:hypothetical protein [Desulfobacterales bacterium]MCP4161421.1 hypothetical protein [Deltaproteobacteria bacterium]
MWNIFKRRKLISDKDFTFQIESYRWLLRNLGVESFYKDTELVLPTKDFFPELFSASEDAVELTFKYVKKYAGMEGWPCELKAQEPDPDRKVAPTVLIQGGDENPLGTFSAERPDKVLITYNPAIASDPIQLISTFAHEFAHYLTGSFKEAPPGGWENWEFATDVAAVFMGFGIFMANSAFIFKQFSDVDSHGWSASQSGYLSEAEFSVSLAIFIKLKEINPKEIYSYLDTNIKSYVKKSLKELKDSHKYLELRKFE